MTEDMQLPDNAIDEFIAIWERLYGEQLSHSDGAARARQLLHFIKTVLSKPTYGDSTNPKSMLESS